MKKHPTTLTGSRRIAREIACIGSLCVVLATAEAGNRRFAYSYETATMAAGTAELESWVTYKTDKDSDPDFQRFDIRHEFEYGVTDRLQLAFYFLDWRYEENAKEGGTTTFQNVAVEGIYNLTNPNTSPFGTALYGEVKGSSEFFELEGKFLLQKNLGPWMFVYNVGGELVWEDRYENDEAEFKQSFGVAYQLDPSWALGIEALHEIEIADAEEWGDSAVYVGPNLSWRKGDFGLTTAAMWQATDLSGEPDFQLRTVFSWHF